MGGLSAGGSVGAQGDATLLVGGAGPRARIALIRAARAHALLAGREFVTPDDVKTMALPVMRHRVALTAEMEIEGLKTDQALQQLLQEVEAPRV